MILLIDNYDSFTFNLYQYFGELGEEIVVARNNQITLSDIDKLKPRAIILSPGPGRPEHAGLCVAIIKAFYKRIPIMGICLGHQAIGYAFGANIVKAKKIMHGKVTKMTHNDTHIFQNIPQTVDVMRYHSLIIEKDSLPEIFHVLAKSNDDKEIMAIKHSRYPLYGLQFHPESVGTSTGKQILHNFLIEIRGRNKDENISSTII